MGHHWTYTIDNFRVFGHEFDGLVFNLDTIFAMWAAMLFLVVLAFIATRKVSIFPSKMQLVFEKILGYFDGLVNGMIHEDGRKHFPLVASLFLFIVTANLMGQLPLKMIELKHGEIASPTNDINLTAALAIIVLIYYVVAGILKKKHKFLLHEVSFVGIISMLVEILELITRPLTLALRLFGNILAGEILITALLGLCAWGLPLPIMFFEILVACVQALVFTMLTTVYIATAVNEQH
ncbi:MAG: F0F1 ATP synthase subunit A [Candidatus Gastranaerophilales bacterium]|nr:F0F1 ATP synthase subunit A [Candidatus Gastranaerophilales bacterium]